MYGYQNSEEVTQGGDFKGGKFGLNVGYVTKFEYNPNAGADGAEQDAIDFFVQIGEKEFRKRFFPVTKVFGKNGEITDTNSEEYKEEHEKAVKLFNAELTSIVETFVSPEDLKTALSTPISTFKDFAVILERLIKTTPNWDKTPVDVFLQYQWAPKGDNTRTFLELPGNVKHGIYLTKHRGEGYVEDRTETHLKYVNPETGDTHPFKRNTWFVNNAFANPTVLEAQPTSSMQGNTGGGTTW